MDLLRLSNYKVCHSYVPEDVEKELKRKINKAPQSSDSSHRICLFDLTKNDFFFYFSECKGYVVACTKLLLPLRLTGLTAFTCS